MKLSLILLIIGIILIMIGGIHHKYPQCEKGTDVQFISEEEFKTMTSNNASKIYKDLISNSPIYE